MFRLVDRHGLLTEDYPNMRPGQEHFARPAADVQGWVKTQEDKATFSLYDVVKNMKPTMLVSRLRYSSTFLFTDSTSLADRHVGPRPLFRRAHCARDGQAR